MTLDELTALSIKISKTLGLTDHIEVLSELFVLSQKYDLNKYPHQSLKAIVAKNLGLNARFFEITNVQAGSSDNEDTVSLIDLKSDNITAENLLTDHEDKKEEQISEVDKTKLLQDGLDLISHREEFVLFVRHVLKYTYREIGSLMGCSDMTIIRMLKKIDNEKLSMSDIEDFTISFEKI